VTRVGHRVTFEESFPAFSEGPVMADICSVTLPATGDQGELRRFRNDFYDCLSAWPDALFELLDAV
jgi:hypothetical protein